MIKARRVPLKPAAAPRASHAPAAAPRRRPAAPHASSVTPAGETALVPVPCREYAAIAAARLARAGAPPGAPPVPGAELLPAAGTSGRAAVVFLTHCADLGAPEVVRALLKEDAPARLSNAGVRLSLVALGSPANAAAFAALFPSWDLRDAPLYADEGGALHRALGFSRGWAPDADGALPGALRGAAPYARLAAMLAGLGSPGTIPEVVRGYVGDRAAEPVFGDDTALGRAFGVLGAGYQRPLELATLRLQNMATSLGRWRDLAPADAALLTWLGGCVVFEGARCVWRHDDEGILRGTDAKELLRRALP